MMHELAIFKIGLLICVLKEVVFNDQFLFKASSMRNHNNILYFALVILKFWSPILIIKGSEMYYIL